LPEKADHAGFFEREAACDEGENRFGKEVIDVFGSFEGAGGFEEFGGDGHLRWGRFGSVGEAESGMRGAGRLRAAASCGRKMVAAIMERWIRWDFRAGLHFGTFLFAN
jgi:hypothetical protein